MIISLIPSMTISSYTSHANTFSGMTSLLRGGKRGARPFPPLVSLSLLKSSQVQWAQTLTVYVQATTMRRKLGSQDDLQLHACMFSVKTSLLRGGQGGSFARAHACATQA